MSSSACIIVSGFDPDVESKRSMTAQVSALCMTSALDLHNASSTTHDQTYKSALLCKNCHVGGGD